MIRYAVLVWLLLIILALGWGAFNSYTELADTHNELVNKHNTLILAHDELDNEHKDLILAYNELVNKHNTLILVYKELDNEHKDLILAYNEQPWGKEFSSVKELKNWLFIDVTDQHPYSKSYDCDDFALALVKSAREDGYWIGFFAKKDHLINFTIIGSDGISIEPQTDEIKIIARMD